MKSFYVKGTTPLWDLSGKNGHPFPILSWLIRLFTFFNISHVLAHFQDIKKVFHVYLTERRYEEDAYLNKGVKIHYIFEIVTTEEKIAELHKFFQARVAMQKGYIFQLIGIAIVSPFRLIGLKLSNPLKFLYGDSMTCSEILALGFKEVLGVDWFNEIPMSTQTERDTIKILDANRGNHTSKGIRVRRLR